MKYDQSYVGRRYGKLTVVSKCPPERRRSRWVLRCDCGREHRASLSDVVMGKVASCGKTGCKNINREFVNHGYVD